MSHKFSFFIYQLDKIFRTALFFNNTQLSPSSILNSLGLSFTIKLSWKFHISSLAKSATSRLGALYRLQPFSSPSNCLQYTGVLSALLWSMHAMCRLLWTEWSQRLFILSDPLLLLSVFYLSNLAAVLLLSQSSVAIFMLTALLNLLNECFPSSHGLAVHVFLQKLTPILSKPLMQEWTSTSSLSSISLVNSGTAFLPLYFLLPTTWMPSRGEFQDTSAT